MIVVGKILASGNPCAAEQSAYENPRKVVGEVFAFAVVVQSVTNENVVDARQLGDFTFVASAGQQSVNELTVGVPD